VSARLERLAEDVLGRDLFLLELSSWEEWPLRIDLPSENFCLLIAGDALGVPRETISTLAGKALAAGCVCLGAWGPRCGVVEHEFDLRLIEIDMPQGSVVLTSSHEGESLKDALVFMVHSTFPTEPWTSSCGACVVGVIDNDAWADAVRRLARALSKSGPPGPLSRGWVDE
jgi:hypothetical protein